MIIAQTPLRVSLAGGGTDLQQFYDIEDGRTISLAIDKYVFVIVSERFDSKVYVNYSKKEIVDHVDELQHELVREAMRMTDLSAGVEVTMLADIPSEGSGLGSSSSLTVGLLNAFHMYCGRQVTAEQLAREACQIEIDICGKPIGKQDQYIAAYGGVHEFQYRRDGTVEARRVKISSADVRRLGSELMLFYTDITRRSSEILSGFSVRCPVHSFTHCAHGPPTRSARPREVANLAYFSTASLPKIGLKTACERLPAC